MLEGLGEGLYIGGARRGGHGRVAVARVPPLASGHALATASDHGEARERDEGGADEPQRSRRRAELGDKKRKRTPRRETTVGYSTSVGARRRELTEGLRRGRWLPEDGDDAGQLLDTVTRAKPLRGGGAEAQTATGRGHCTQSACTVMPLTRSPRALACSGGDGLELVVYG